MPVPGDERTMREEREKRDASKMRDESASHVPSVLSFSRDAHPE